MKKDYLPCFADSTKRKRWKEMSKYISKSKLVETLTKYKFGAIGNDEEREYTKEMVLVILNGLPTISETEIIRKAFDRTVERLESERATEEFKALKNANETFVKGCIDNRVFAYGKAIEIIKEECGISE